MAHNNKTNPIAKYRRSASYTASIESVAIEARLQARLDPATWGQIEAEWNDKPVHESYLSQQRQQYLETTAARHDVSLAGIGMG